MKRGIVLSGGGTKGAYEVGVWRALNELGIDYQIVTGTSIGSINGALMAMQDYERSEKMWLGMQMGDLMNENYQRGHTVQGFLKSIFSPGEFMRSKISAGAVDNSPFPEFIHTNIDEEVIRKSPVDYGLVTVRNRDRKPFSLTKSMIPEGLLADYIIASSSVYPVFPMHLIGEEYYIDGMYHDNLPIDLAVSMGAGELIVVDLHQEAQHPDYEGRPYVTYITPSEDLGGILAFDPVRIRKNIEMGYRDAMRSFGKYKGYVYCFRPESLSGFDSAVERYNLYCAEGQATANLNAKTKLKKKMDVNQMFRLIEKYARGHAVQKEDYFIRGAEIAAEVCGLSHETIWDMKDLVDAVKEKIGPAEAYPDRTVFECKNANTLYKRMKALKKEKDSLYLMGCLYYYDHNADPGYAIMREILWSLPKELAGCLFVRAIEAC